MTSKTSEHPLAIGMKILQGFGRAGQYVWQTQAHLATIKKDPVSLEQRVEYVKESIRWLRSKLKDPKGQWRELPVDFRTFVECPALLNKYGKLWPEVIKEGQVINSGKYVEVVLTGAIGVAKSTLAIYTQAYQMYVLSCMNDAWEVFDLDPSSEILIVFQSISKELAKTVDYNRFRAMIDDSPYFRHEFPYNQELKSEMRFLKARFIVKPISGADTAAIGQNVIGGILDELNFMEVTENSKQTKDGGTYDQAMQNYNSIAMRRESRFMQMGSLPGMLCLVSSRNYPGQFTDVKELEARTNPRIYIYDKKLWDLRPQRYAFHTGVRAPAIVEQFGDDCAFWFKMFIGDATRKPRIMDDAEDPLDTDINLVMMIPIEHKRRFMDDPLKSLRDIAGVATLALHPYIINTDAVAKCFNVVQSIASRDECDFDKTKLQLYPDRIMHPEEPRFAHVDLAMSKDSCGVVVGHVSGFEHINRGDYMETLPIVQLDLILEIRPPRGGEIEFANVRKLLYKLREIGVPLKWVTFDSFQSTDSMQILSQNGFTVGYQSVDITTTPYDVTKQALYDERIRAPNHPKVQRELITLEFETKTQKIDHPPNGTKDVSDALAGVVYGLTMRRELWVRHGISLNRIPASLTQSEEKGKRTLSYTERLKEEWGKGGAA